MDVGGDPEEIGKWISDAKAQRLARDLCDGEAAEVSRTCPKTYKLGK
jgi:hypothetical protein